MPKKTKGEETKVGVKRILAESKPLTSSDGFEPKKSSRPKNPHTISNQSIHQNGDNNLAINQMNGDLIHSPKVINKIIAKPQPGIENITEEQVAAIHRLVDEVYDLEQKLKKDPAAKQHIWKRLNIHCDVGSFRMIKLSDFDKACKFLRMWIGRLGSGKSAPKKDPIWRQRRYSAVHKICRQFNLEEKRKEYMQTKFQASSMTELDDEELDKLHRAVLGWKLAAKKHQG